MDIREIADRLEIEQLIVRYTIAIDRKDWDLLDTVFTPDAILDYESSAPDAKGPYPKMKLMSARILFAEMVIFFSALSTIFLICRKLRPEK